MEDRRRNIVLSYIRDGLSEGEAVRAADKLICKLETRRRVAPSSLIYGLPMDIEAQIINRLYEALELIDAPLDLLQIVGSWKDTQPAEETLKQLEAFIAAQREGE